MSTTERKPRRTLDQDFIDGAVMLVTQEGYKNPSDRATYLGAIDHIDIPVVCSAVLFVGQACWVTEVVDGTQVPNTPIRTASRTLRQKRRGATIEKLQQATEKRKNPWIRKETKGFRQSGRRDSNPRPLPPQGSALARLRYGPMFRRSQQPTCRLIAPVDRLIEESRV